MKTTICKILVLGKRAEASVSCKATIIKTWIITNTEVLARGLELDCRRVLILYKGFIWVKCLKELRKDLKGLKQKSYTHQMRWV